MTTPIADPETNPFTANRELAIFQTNIAKEWLRRSNNSSDIFAQFYFYFTAFNALYFVWSMLRQFDEYKAKLKDIEKVNSTPPGSRIIGEVRQIAFLLSQLAAHQQNELIQSLQPEIEYFLNRRALNDMGKRNARQREGNSDEGKAANEQLRESASCLIGLGRIIYLMRCNLVHGSKGGGETDQDLIEVGVKVLREIVPITISLTEEKYCL